MRKVRPPSPASSRMESVDDIGSLDGSAGVNRWRAPLAAGMALTLAMTSGARRRGLSTARAHPARGPVGRRASGEPQAAAGRLARWSHIESSRSSLLRTGSRSSFRPLRSGTGVESGAVAVDRGSLCRRVKTASGHGTGDRRSNRCGGRALPISKNGSTSTRALPATGLVLGVVSRAARSSSFAALLRHDERSRARRVRATWSSAASASRGRRASALPPGEAAGRAGAAAPGGCRGARGDGEAEPADDHDDSGWEARGPPPLLEELATGEEYTRCSSSGSVLGSDRARCFVRRRVEEAEAMKSWFVTHVTLRPRALAAPAEPREELDRAEASSDASLGGSVPRSRLEWCVASSGGGAAKRVMEHDWCLGAAVVEALFRERLRRAGRRGGRYSPPA